jgi:hypothetical protein
MRDMEKMEIRTVGVSDLAIHRWRRHRPAKARRRIWSPARRQLSRASAIMRVKAVAACHWVACREDPADFTPLRRGHAQDHGRRAVPKHGRSLATARRGAMPTIGKPALHI